MSTAGDRPDLMQKLCTAYEEPQRKYHTLQHLTECLSLLDKNLDLATEPSEVEIALWFHDAIYDVKGSDNEAKSAEWAGKELASAGVSSECIARIQQHIMATCHSALPLLGDQTLLVDIDLSILGAARPRFEEYEIQVRQEYSWVPGLIFRQKRRAILKEFLARKPIYGTARMREKFEQQARENLAFSLK